MYNVKYLTNFCGHKTYLRCYSMELSASYLFITSAVQLHIALPLCNTVTLPATDALTGDSSKDINVNIALFGEFKSNIHPFCVLEFK